MKKIALIVLITVLGLSLVFAQGKRKGHKHHHPKWNKEAKAALQKFHQEEIFPVKKVAHDQFLAKLSQEDRVFLDQKREEGNALHQEMKSMRQEMKGLKDSGKSREEMHEMRKEKFAPLREKHKSFMESMKPFMEKNELLVKASMESIKENREAWKTKKEAILDQYLSEEEKTKRAECKKEGAEKHAHKGRHHGHRGEKGHEGRKGKAAVRFVLWDGEMRTPKGEGNPSNERTESSVTGLEKLSSGFSVNTYPNPAISQTTLLLNLNEAAKKIKVSIINTEGKQVWVKNYNKLTAGEHQIDVDLQKMANGQYFYTVEIGEERRTKSFIVNK